jgi:rare lipoprotein A
VLARLVFALLILAFPAFAKDHAPAVVQQGKASIYADRFQGQLAANGEPHDQNDLTAASRILPLGTRATVTNLETGKSVQVEITDRGPYVGGRIIDLSRRAAREIGLTLKTGLARVRVEAQVRRQPTPELKEKVAQLAEARAKPVRGNSSPRRPLSTLRRERYGRE